MSQSLNNWRLEEAEFAGRGAPLYRRSVVPVDRVRAVLAILPGYGDHAGRYLHFLKWLAERGVAAHAMDFRGHGLAGGRRGYVRRWDEFLDDLTAFLALPAIRSGQPLFVLGHSHGGLVTAIAGIRGRLEVAGAILSAPFLRPSMRVPRRKVLLGRVANVLIPWLAVPSDLPDESMSTDQSMIADGRSDPLLLHHATPRWYFGTCRAQAEALARAGDFRLPLLCLAGDDDRIADTAAAAEFCRRAGSNDKVLKIYKSCRHEILRESQREMVFQDIFDWLNVHAA